MISSPDSASVLPMLFTTMFAENYPMIRIRGPHNFTVPIFNTYQFDSWPTLTIWLLRK
jgi:hypothetical protein